ncbi:unnamed protein product [Toxocara canis]|uniref:DUF167 domain-containing protein n=1 Tax=Toxocara canis TaxID=6265 RepID=A0A183U294_TOXCA|nr:unnamed protein product [Toxocara canis]
MTLTMYKNKKEDASISMDKNGRIVLRIHAKPNAKKSRVTEIGDSEIEVAIAAPPRDGQANDTLREAIAVILGLRKSDVSFDAVAKKFTD